MTAVVYERAGPIATLSLNRPDRLNAMDVELMGALRTALIDCAADDDVRCVVVRGEGESFCAGGDVSLSAERRRSASVEAPGAELVAAQRMLRHHAQSVELMYSMPKPVLAALRGHVVGGGLALALAADLRVASTTTKLRVGYLSAGLSGDFGISYLLPEIVGPAHAKQLAFLDERVDAEQALQLGLLSELVPDGQLESRVEGLAQQLAGMPTLALGNLKENIAFARRNPLGEAIRNEATSQRLVTLTEDAREAGEAFRDRRPPRFRGR